jgi:PPK2 family polyphosphate:nucleotide phosphotransferase
MKFRAHYGINGKKKIQLRRFNADEKWAVKDRREAEKLFRANLGALAELQYRLYAEQKQALLIVLQGIDAAGKDGTIRRVFSTFNPQGCSVTPFKVPTAEERGHDFLWRVHQKVPGSGHITIFNRSHYEDVLVVRVHDLVPRSVWSRRYAQINEFEKMLAANGTTIIKFLLLISKDEQRQRFRKRLDDPTRNWKFSREDVEKRKYWDDYLNAFEDAVNRCARPHAPWYCIPADRKWHRNLVISEIVKETLMEMDPRIPRSREDLSGIVIE